MNEHQRRELELHVAGATVRHAGPYASIDIPAMMDPPSQDIIRKWIQPFYLTNPVHDRTKFETAYSALRGSIDSSLITQLLTFANWRPRIVGAYFAAIENLTSHCDHIGRLLLRSDVCYAGRGYAFALARFNTDESISFLCKYLDHYLTQPDLWFDQGSVMGAIAHLDIENDTNRLEKYMDRWDHFIQKKPGWGLTHEIEYFAENMEAIREIASNAT